MLLRLLSLSKYRILGGADVCHDRIGERSLLAMTGSVSAVEPSSFQKVYGPFDIAQGSYAVAVAELVEVQGSLLLQLLSLSKYRDPILR